MGEAKRQQGALRYGVDRRGNVTFAPSNEGELGSELFDINPSTKRIRPWQERREQARAVAAAYRKVFERTGDLEVDRIGRGCACCGTMLGFEELQCEALEATKLRLKRANFCRGRLCPLCNWRRSLKLRWQLGSVLDADWAVCSTHRHFLLTLTVPNTLGEDFDVSIDELLKAFGRLSRYARFKAAVVHWFRALEVSAGRDGVTLHPHFHVLLVIDEPYFDAQSRLYIAHAEWCAMWERALRATSPRVVDIRVTDNPGEVAKYVTKPGAYLKLDGDGAWWCDPDRLAALHYALGSRRLVAWSRSLSEIRRRLGFLDEDEDEDGDLVSVGDDDEAPAWVPFREVVYRWRRTEEGRMAYKLWAVKPISTLDPDEREYDEYARERYDDPEDYDPMQGGWFQWS
jgi:plasmid rolling circle replication initiator protein Rep